MTHRRMTRCCTCKKSTASACMHVLKMADLSRPATTVLHWRVAIIWCFSTTIPCRNRVGWMHCWRPSPNTPMQAWSARNWCTPMAVCKRLAGWCLPMAMLGITGVWRTRHAASTNMCAMPITSAVPPSPSRTRCLNNWADWIRAMHRPITKTPIWRLQCVPPASVCCISPRPWWCMTKAAAPAPILPAGPKRRRCATAWCLRTSGRQRWPRSYPPAASPRLRCCIANSGKC